MSRIQGIVYVFILSSARHKDVEEAYSGVPLATVLAQVNAPVGKQLQNVSLTTAELLVLR